MEVKSFTLNHIGQFKELVVPLSPTQNFSSNITIFVGSNGSGKTILLKALATSLSWFIARLRSEKGSGSPISEEMINNDQVSGAIDIQVSEQIHNETHEFRWRLAKAKQGRKGEYSSELVELNKLVDYYRQSLTDQPYCDLPLIIFYPVERAVLNTRFKLSSDSFAQLDGYASSNQGLDFQSFFRWFHERESIENLALKKLHDDYLMPAIKNHREYFYDDLVIEYKSKLEQAKDRYLNTVRYAIYGFMPELKNLRVGGVMSPFGFEPHLLVEKNDETLNVSQLSQGEKSLMALVGDIARRLAMMNPTLDNPLLGKGIVLIDEVDMHLHPTWQRNLVDRLIQTFPNCQFVLTTHSPLVISDNKNILVYALEQGELIELPSQYGQDANSVLLGVMDTDIRNEFIDEQLKDLLDAIQNADLNKAKKLLSQLESELPVDHLELVKARLLLRKQELRRAAH